MEKMATTSAHALNNTVIDFYIMLTPAAAADSFFDFLLWELPQESMTHHKYTDTHPYVQTHAYAERWCNLQQFHSQFTFWQSIHSPSSPGSTPRPPACHCWPLPQHAGDIPPVSRDLNVASTTWHLRGSLSCQLNDLHHQTSTNK